MAACTRIARTCDCCSSLSHNTGSTRESKVQSAVKEVTAQYMSTIEDLKAQIALLSASNPNGNLSAEVGVNPVTGGGVQQSLNVKHPFPVGGNGDDVLVDTTSESDGKNTEEISLVGSNASLATDTSFDPFQETITISSSSSSSDNGLPYVLDCVTPSPFRKGFNNKSSFAASNKTLASTPASITRTPKRRLRKKGKRKNKNSRRINKSSK